MSTAALEAPKSSRKSTSESVLDSEALYEIIDGVKVELPPTSTKSGMIASDLGIEMGAFALSQKLGKIYFELLIKLKLKDNRERDRRPDFIFVSKTKWPLDKERPEDKAWEIVPDICVEVISPSDSSEEVEEKIDEYFEAGVTQVWIVYPKRQKIKIFDSSLRDKILGPEDTLTCSEILPGFALPLNRLFQSKPKEEVK